MNKLLILTFLTLCLSACGLAEQQMMEAGKEIGFTLENIKVWDSTTRVLS